MSLNKRGYFQGGGGVNEPTPGQSKYDVEPIEVIKSRKLPFTYNTYQGPYFYIDKYNSIVEFLNKARKDNINTLIDKASIANRMFQLGLIKNGYFQGGGGVNQPEPKKKKYKSDPAIVVQPRFKEPFYRNYDLYNTPGEHSPGAGWHDMEKYKSIQEFLKAKRKKLKDKYKADDSWIQDDNSKTKKNPNIEARGAIFERIIKTADHMMPPKEHGTEIYDWKNSIYQGTPKSPNKKCRDKNDIDFPIDDQVSMDLAGPLGEEPGDDNPIGHGNLGGGWLDVYLPKHDFEGKHPTALNFGRDYDENHNSIDKLINKYLSSSETGLFGLPDGIDPEGHDADQTEQVEEPFTGTSDIGTDMYEDKWNI